MIDISKFKCNPIPIEFGRSYSFYRDAAGPAPKGSYSRRGQEPQRAPHLLEVGPETPKL